MSAEPVSKLALLRVARIVFGTLTLVALVRQLAIHVSLGYPLGNFFSYYTILSNLFAGAVLLMAAALPDTNRALITLRFISVVNMTLVGIVFVSLLRETDLGNLLPWVNIVHHYLMPCVVLVDWLVDPPRGRLARSHVFMALSFPLAYLVYSLIRGQMTGWYPYPFLNPSVAGGTAGVTMYIAGITVVFCVVGSALLFVANRRSRPAGIA